MSYVSDSDKGSMGQITASQEQADGTSALYLERGSNYWAAVKVT
jgi:hypothetical protein